MPVTTAQLGGGIVINEVHAAPSGAAQDYNGSGTADLNNEYIEILNLSGGAIDISGYEIYAFGNLGHTFAPGTILPPGGRITVVDSAGGTGNAITGVTAPAVYSDAGLILGNLQSTLLYDPGANEYVVAQGSGGAPFLLSFDLPPLLTAHPGATQVGPIEVLPASATGDATGRVSDGDTTWVNGDPSPGFVNCFLSGTLIRTDRGDIAVEDLQPEMQLVQWGGGVVPLRFLFRQTLATRFLRDEARWPVRIEAGALGVGLPEIALTVTGDHALFLEGALVQAAALVNGATIRRLDPEELGEVFTVWHVETGGHHLILANGAPTESLADGAARAGFDNYADFVAGFANDPAQADLPYPRVQSPRQLPAALARWLAAHQAA